MSSTDRTRHQQIFLRRNACNASERHRAFQESSPPTQALAPVCTGAGGVWYSHGASIDHINGAWASQIFYFLPDARPAILPPTLVFAAVFLALDRAAGLAVDRVADAFLLFAATGA